VLWLVVIVVFCLTGCGKVGEPKPPFVRIPERVQNLAANQSGYNIVLSWTNPAHNVDGSTASDLATIHVTSNGASVADVTSTGAGEPQSYSLPAQTWLGESRVFNVWVETTRHKVSDVSTVRAQPVDIPGPARNVKVVVDQYAIHVTWDPPEQNANFATGYFVQRMDKQASPPLAMEAQFTDTGFDYRKTYAYQIVAARQIDSRWVTGLPAAPVSIEAVDRTPPEIPTGLAIIVTDGGAFVRWEASQELDLKGYFVFRNGRKITPQEPQTGNSWFDPEYRPNTTYSVSAIDEFGNESAPSAPIS
jgi:hypothetical protein